jgi:hypothetical protein
VQAGDAQDEALGPVTPSSLVIRFDARSRPCATAHTSCMNWSTSGSSRVSPFAGQQR